MYENVDYGYHIRQRNKMAKKMENLLAARDEMVLENEGVDDWFTKELGRVLIEDLDLRIQEVQEDKARHQEHIDNFMDQNK